MRGASITAVIVAVLVAALAAAEGERARYTVYRDAWSGHWRADRVGRENDALGGIGFEPAAVVDYANTIMRTGWDVLNVTTSNMYSDYDQAFAAGFGEGTATQAQSWNNYMDAFGVNVTAPLPAKAQAWMDANWAYVRAQVAAKNATDPYWYQVGLVVAQFDGLLAGLNNGAPAGQAFNAAMLSALQAQGDLMDIYSALNISMMLKGEEGEEGGDDVPAVLMARAQMAAWRGTFSHCSALVKLANDMSDIFIGHATWSTYNQMVRVYKHYTLNYKGLRGEVASPTISLSGYAAVLPSIDDWLTSSAGLIVTETSLNVDNATMYTGNINPTSVLYWMRSLVATRMARTGAEWATLFGRENSGTYNNEWLVLQAGLFTPFAPDLLPGLLTIAIQFPGVFAAYDATERLQLGFFPSFNVPSNYSLYVLSGNQAAAETQGYQMNSYGRNVRLQLFRSMQSDVSTLADFQNVMQYNQWQTNPLQQGDPTYAVASRGDLVPGYGMCWGAIDAKTTSMSLFNNGGHAVQAYSGPTPQAGIFSFANVNSSAPMCSPTFGIPQTFNFAFETFAPVAPNI